MLAKVNCCYCKNSTVCGSKQCYFINEERIWNLGSLLLKLIALSDAVLLHDSTAGKCLLLIVVG